jgi:hypothetical protein
MTEQLTEKLEQLKEKLEHLGFSNNMINKTVEDFTNPNHNYFVVYDNSGSMNYHDGKKIDAKGNITHCTRIEEARSNMEYFIDNAEISYNPVRFCFFDGKIIEINESSTANTKVEIIEKINKIPLGKTPLCAVITSIFNKINIIEDKNNNDNNNKYILTIITDGVPSDGELKDILLNPIHSKILNKINFIIRLCTNEESITKYWNEIDEDLEISLDVLDDLIGERKEIEKKNKWLSYPSSLHLMRLHSIDPIIDRLDEKSLSLSDISKVCELILDESLPDPNISIDEFKSKINKCLIDKEKVPIYSYSDKPVRFELLINTNEINPNNTTNPLEFLNTQFFDTTLNLIYDYVKSFLMQKFNLINIKKSCKTFIEKNNFLSIILIGLLLYIIYRLLPFIITMIFCCIIAYIFLFIFKSMNIFLCL